MGDILFSEHAAAGLKRLHEEAGERAFGLHTESVAGILDGLQEGVLESADAFAVRLPTGHSYQQILDQAHAELMLVSLNTVIDLEQTASALAELAGENKALQARALTDDLTELANRAALEDALSREVFRRMRGEHDEDALGVMMVDIDEFKSVNDRFGHAHGDEILRHVARTMAGVTRKADVLARYGGEEFCVVMTRTTYAGVTAAAERLRRAVETHPAVLDSGEEVRITISVGAAATAEIDDPDDGKHLLEVADAALYRAKANGRNRVEVAPPPTRASAT